MAIELRRAYKEDADFLAWAMLSASRAHLSRGVWDLIIGMDKQGCLEYLKRLATAEPHSLCHFDSFSIAAVDGQPAAALCAYDMRAGGWAVVAEAMASVQRDLAWTEQDVSASYRRVGPVWACFLPDMGADWGIENIATLPEYRRRGLVGALLEATLREAAGRGCKLAQITTYIDNHVACSAYEKAGFRVSDQRRCTEFESLLGSPGFVRLIRET
jgi:ribosomal protein S18 acetylase RimI-like enzyme